MTASRFPTMSVGLWTSRALARFVVGAASLLSCVFTLGAQGVASRDSASQQSIHDAWFTGPVFAASASTLPQGHFYAEPYLFDAMSRGASSVGSRTYLIYGLLDRVSVGLIPAFGFNKPASGPSSTRIGVGDVTFTSQYRLTGANARGLKPVSSAVLQGTFPSGRYDRLGERPSDGLGSGAYSTTVGLFSQWLSWLPNTRILRTRFDVSVTFSRQAHVEGVSVYGTSAGFIGTAKPGVSLTLNPAWEYSVTKPLVLALDLVYVRNESTRVSGQDLSGTAGGTPSSVAFSSARSTTTGLIPAIEYNWSSRVGVIAGARFIVPAGGSRFSVTPVVALSMFH